MDLYHENLNSLNNNKLFAVFVVTVVMRYFENCLNYAMQPFSNNLIISPIMFIGQLHIVVVAINRRVCLQLWNTFITLIISFVDLRFWPTFGLAHCNKHKIELF